MLVRFEPHEWAVVRRGLLLMCVCVVSGSILVEIQLNQMTYWQDAVRVFNARRADSGAYFAYLFGEEYYVQAVRPIGTISNSSRSLDIKLLNFGFSLPTKLDIDVNDAAESGHRLWRQGVREAFALKQALSDTWLQVKPQLAMFVQRAAGWIR